MQTAKLSPFSWCAAADTEVERRRKGKCWHSWGSAKFPYIETQKERGSDIILCWTSSSDFYHPVYSAFSILFCNVYVFLLLLQVQRSQGYITEMKNHIVLGIMCVGVCVCVRDNLKRLGCIPVFFLHTFSHPGIDTHTHTTGGDLRAPLTPSHAFPTSFVTHSPLARPVASNFFPA